MNYRTAQPIDLDIGDATRLRVLEFIRSAQEISRVDIARALEISPATITAATGTLLDAGLIQEVQASSVGYTRRGRPRVMLQVKGDPFKVAGVKVAQDAILIVIANFRGEEIGTYSAPLAVSPMHAESLVQEIVRTFQGACDALKIARCDISGLAISLPGFVNGATGFVHWSSSVIERNVDMKSLIQRQLHCPAFIDNDANLVAKAEHLFGAGRGSRNLLVVTIEQGVGMGIVLDGELHRGERGCGAEFGHMKVQFEGAVCQCGQRGCLEAYVGDYALLRDTSIGLQGGSSGALQEILDLAISGDARTREVLDRASQILGFALANLVNLFDPERIIIARSRPPYNFLNLDEVMGSLRRNTLQIDASLPEITVRNLDEKMWATGAAAHAIEMVSILKISELDTRKTVSVHA